MGLYQNLEDEVIADIARRVKNTGRYTETAELMAKSMVENGYSAEKIQAEVMKMLRADKNYKMAVAENTAAYKQEVQDIINKTVKEAKAAGNDLVAEAGNMAWNNDLSMWQEHGVDLKKPNSMSQLLLAFQKQTAGELKNLTRTMGFKNTVFGTTGVLNAYQREMDLALLKVATGTFSYDQAVNDCVHRLAQSGLRSIDYANGRSYQLDTAARMSVRTGLSQLSGKIMEENLKSSGQDLVITSQHMGSRPEHVPWQNKVFSYSGKNKKYPDFFKETGYGTATGLKGVNCTHDFYPFWEGASVIPDDIKEPAPVKINGKEYDYYQVSQQQRKMERGIRATKREIEAQKAIGGDTSELQSKLRKQNSDYKQFSAAAGVKVKNNRLRVEYGSSNLIKTVSYQKGNKLAIESTKKKNYAIQDAKSIKEINENGTESLLNAYEERRKHFGLNVTPASELKKNKLNPITVNYDGVSLETAKAFESTIQKLSNEYYTGFTKIEVGDKKEFFGTHIFATTQHNNTVGQKALILNPHKTGDYNKMTEKIKELSDKGYAVKIANGLEGQYVATHEFAHSLIDLSGNYKNYVGMDVKQMKCIKKELDSVYDTYKSEVNVLEAAYKEKELAFLNGSISLDVDMDELAIMQKEAVAAKEALDEVKISRYSMENADEFMAEAFTQAKLTESQSPYTKKVIDIIDKYFKK